MTSSMCAPWPGATSSQSNILVTWPGVSADSADWTPPATRQLPARSKAFVDRTLPADRRTRCCGPQPEAGPWFINGPQPEAGPWFINRDNIEDLYLDNIKWYDEDLAAHGEIPVELDSCSPMQMWPEASQSMLRRDFKEAARGFREAYEKSRGWHEDDSVPFTTNQQLLLELILQAEVMAMNLALTK